MSFCSDQMIFRLNLCKLFRSTGQLISNWPSWLTVAPRVYRWSFVLVRKTNNLRPRGDAFRRSPRPFSRSLNDSFPSKLIVINERENILFRPECTSHCGGFKLRRLLRPEGFRLHLQDFCCSLGKFQHLNFKVQPADII
jgi:hypothetical protein